MITCIVLGMGIPTIPNYIITSSIAGPALLHLGVPLIVSHMFVFYFGILADLTPPVALACFAAAPIAKEKGLKIAFEAIKVAAAGFIIPYMAVYSPALMLQAGGAAFGPVRISRCRRLHPGQDDAGDRAVGLDRDRLPPRPAACLGASVRRRRRVHPRSRAAGDGRDRVRAFGCLPLHALDARAQTAAGGGDTVSSGICVIAAGKTLALAAITFTLSWTHSVEKITWAEHWKLTPAGFVVTSATVEGSGAGMDPPEGARLVGDKWVYVPDLPPQEDLVLAASGATVSGWKICSGGACQVVGKVAERPIVVRRCSGRTGSQ